MSHTVTAQFHFRCLPSAVRLGVRTKSCCDFEHAQESLRVHAQEKFLIPLHRIPEWTVEETYVRQWKSVHTHRDLVAHFHAQVILCQRARAHPDYANPDEQR